MARKFLTAIDLTRNELQNGVIQNLSADPGSPVKGLVYFNTGTNRFRVYNGTGFDEMGTSSSSGDTSSNTSVSVDGEVVLFNGTSGKSIKRATGSGIAKLTSGVLSTATSGTDYAPATSGNSILKGNGSGGFSTAAVADYPTLNQNTTGTASNVTGTVAPANGGTGLTSYTVGDIIVATATGTLSSLSDVATGNVLISGGTGTAPSYGKVGLTTHVTGTLPIANGGSGTTTATGTGNLVLANSPTLVTPNLGTPSAATLTNATGLPLATGVTGNLPVANGGTGSTSATGARSNLGAAASGANSDITSLSGVTSLTMNSNKITSVADPTNPQDAATKNYVDMAVQGLTWKNAVTVATTTAGTLASSFANNSVVDGVTLSTGMRILLKNQTDGTTNGIYTVNATGAPSRATDSNTSAEQNGATVYVMSGTTNADTAWTQTTDNVTLGTTSESWALISGATTPQATTTTAGKVQLATQSVAQAKSDNTMALTAASVADFARKATGTLGDGSTTSYAITHGLGTQYVTAQVFDAGSNLQVEADVVQTSATTTTINFTVAPSANAYRYVIIG